MRFAVKLAVAAVSTAIAFSGAAQSQNAPKKAAPRSAGGECQTELKQTDGYRELSAALKCLNDRIRALEASRSTGATSVPRGQVDVAAPASERSQILQNGSLRFELQKCGWSPTNSDIFCQFEVTNLTKEDRRVCLGLASRLVTDKGTAFSAERGFSGSIGSANNVDPMRLPGIGPVCDTLTPLIKVDSWVRFNGSRGQANNEVQFLRVDCGPGCVYEAYKIPIK